MNPITCRMKFNGHYFNFCTFTTDAPISVKANEFMDFVDLNSYKALQAKNERLQEALMSIGIAEGCENYPEELRAAILMDKARIVLIGE